VKAGGAAHRVAKLSFFHWGRFYAVPAGPLKTRPAACPARICVFGKNQAGGLPGPDMRVWHYVC